MEALFFEPIIEVSDWPKVIKALKVLYPNIRWGSGVELSADGVWFASNGLIIHGGIPYLEDNLWDSKEDFINRVKYINQDVDIKDGWEYLGFKQDIDFDSLYESKLIRRAIKESIDEFDWVDTNPNTYNSGQGLFNLMQDFFQTNGKYYLEQHEFNGLKRIAISDDTGIYYSYHINDFTIDRIKSDIKTTLEELFHNYEAKVRNEYQQLAKALEPIIGPINSSMNESEEFDWVDVNPNLYDLITNFFKHEHPEYWLEKDSDYENITISDKTGNYIMLDEVEFTIENIRKNLYDDIINLEGRKAFGLRDEYIQLAKVLEPIIGPINID